MKRGPAALAIAATGPIFATRTTHPEVARGFKPLQEPG